MLSWHNGSSASFLMFIYELILFKNGIEVSLLNDLHEKKGSPRKITQKPEAIWLNYTQILRNWRFKVISKLIDVKSTYKVKISDLFLTQESLRFGATFSYPSHGSGPGGTRRDRTTLNQWGTSLFDRGKWLTMFQLYYVTGLSYFCSQISVTIFTSRKLLVTSSACYFSNGPYTVSRERSW